MLDSEKKDLPSTISTETEMMFYLYKLEFDNQDVALLNTPMVEQSNGSLCRPTTDDTLNYFNQLKLHDGSCLVISNNPYISRQTKVAQRILDQIKFPTAGAGSECKESYLDIIMLMDAFSRTLCEEYCNFHTAMQE